MQSKHARLVIVSASTSHASGTRIPAKDAYTSYQFQRRRTYAERFGTGWLIFSAVHGLLAPETEIDPRYAPTRWIQVSSGTLTDQLRSNRAAEFDLIELIAGRDYLDALRGPAQELGLRLTAPLVGRAAGMGEQTFLIAWRLRVGVPFDPLDDHGVA